VLKIWDPNDIEGEPQVRQGIMPHHEVLLRLDAMDLDRGTFVGDHFFLLTLSSFFFLRGQGCGSPRILSDQ